MPRLAALAGWLMLRTSRVATACAHGGYTTVDIGANYSTTDRTTLDAAIYSLFDEDVTGAENNPTRKVAGSGWA